MDPCHSCVEILEQGNQLLFNVCSPEHTWVYIEGLSPAPKPGEIYRNGEMASMSQVFRDLGKDWKL